MMQAKRKLIMSLKDLDGSDPASCKEALYTQYLYGIMEKGDVTVSPASDGVCGKSTKERDQEKKPEVVPPKEERMDRRIRQLAEQVDAHHISRREFVRRTALITGGTAVGLGVLRSMAHAQGTKMRVWLFNPPAGATGYGLGQLGDGKRVWALLPSCRPPQADDPPWP